MSDYTVISSRVRFARNLQGFRFPSAMPKEEQERALSLVLPALKKRELSAFCMNDLTETARRVLLEQGIISKELYANPDGWVATDESDLFSVMVMEEDVLRLSRMGKGFSLRAVYDAALREETALSAMLPFAFHKEFGYLTTCVTNLGTGMRASVMLFLPALERAGSVPALCADLQKMHLTVRGVLGEGTNSEHSVYQISNARSLGVSEEEIILAVESATAELCRMEAAARYREWSSSPRAVENRIKRATAALLSAPTLSYGDMMHALCAVKEGVSLGILPEGEDLDDLSVSLRPAHVEALAGRPLTKKERDRSRAECVRKILGTLRGV